MDIKEATILAMKNGKYMYRKSEKEEGIDVNVLPTNTWDCCILISDSTDIVGKRWNPTANDLMADDWEVS